MFKGKRIRLRDFKEEDMKLDYKYMNDPEVVLNKRTGIPYPTSWEKEKKYFDSLTKLKDDYDFAIEVLDSELYIGVCGVDKIDWKNSFAEVFIYIGDENYRGKGYGTEAMQILLDFIFSEINVNKVQLVVFGFNERAIKSYEKNGFVVEGRIRQNLFRNGKYHDKVVMGMLRAEYYKTHTR